MERELLEEIVFDERATELLVAPAGRDGAEIELPLLRDGADTVGVLERVTLMPLLLLDVEGLNELEEDLATAGVLPDAGSADERFEPVEEMVNPLPWFVKLP